MKEHYPTSDMPTMLSLLPGRTKTQIYHRAHNLKLKKTPETRTRILNETAHKHLFELGKAHRFKKGQAPVNKGMKIEEYMSSEGIERSSKTRFKKGHTPANTKHDGAITIRHPHKQRGARPYLYIRLAKGKWQEYHRYLWIKQNGLVPAKHVIRFKDGNTMNCCIENLECISMAENAIRNADHEKAFETMRRKGNRGAVDLTDNYVAGMVAGHDKELTAYLLEHRQDIIRAARANYKLNRAIKNGNTI